MIPKNYLKLMVLFFFLSLNISAQTMLQENCGKELKGFIYDTQDYLIHPKETTVFDFVFYPGFTYRLELCTRNTNIRLDFLLIDEKGNEQFKKNITYGFFRDFNFETVFHGKIQIKPVETDGQQAQIIIGYKKNKT